MTRNVKLICWVDPKLRALMDEAKEQTGVGLSTQVRMALREFLGADDRKPSKPRRGAKR